MSKQRRADLLLVMTTFFWGASYYLTDICLADLPPMTLNAFRFIVAFLVLGLIFWKHVVHINRTTLRYSLIVGLALAGTYVAYNYGITRTSLSNAAFICALQVIFAPLLGFLFFRQRPGWKLGVALVVCTVGMALLTLNGELRPASGDLICLITPLCYAVDLLITEKAVRDPRVDPLGLGVCQLAVVGIVTLALALVLGEPVHLPTSGRTWAAALFLGIFCSGGGLCHPVRAAAVYHRQPCGPDLYPGAGVCLHGGLCHDRRGTVSAGLYRRGPDAAEPVYYGGRLVLPGPQKACIKENIPWINDWNAFCPGCRSLPAMWAGNTTP